MPDVLQPRGPWRRVWLEGLAIAVLVLGALEIVLRQHGHRPSVVSDWQLWAWHRDRANGAGRDVVALVGASRLQIGFIPEAFSSEHPDVETVQLAVAAKGPFATLRDLAENESFSGVVLCSIDALTLQPWQLEAQRDFVERYHRDWGPGRKASLLLSATLQERLVVLQPPMDGLQPRRTDAALSGLSSCELPAPNYVHTRFDRRRVIDWERVDTKKLVERRLAFLLRRLEADPPASAEVWSDIVAQVAALAERIEARGGSVVFVRYPRRRTYVALGETLFPRERYWDPLAAKLGDRVIDYLDMPGQEELRCPDDSHLDPPSAERFTRWLAAEMARRGVL